MKEPSEFTKSVIATIKKIPRGKVATYAQVAAVAGRPHAVRAVVWILHSCSKTYRLPWQRVINSKGKISFPVGSRNFLKQKGLLEREGVRFLGPEQVEMTRFQWKRKPRNQGKKRNSPSLFS